MCDVEDIRTSTDTPAIAEASHGLYGEHRTVIGFHGTSIEKADLIMSTGTFLPSRNDYDWLGHGVYFWEHAPLRAWQWAKNKYEEYAAVVEAEVSLGRCLDLTDIRYTDALKKAYDLLRDAHLEEGKTLPMNRNKARCLDCLVINYVASLIFPECQTVRAPFLEGDEIYAGARLYTQSHIQLVVRDRTAITAIRQLVSNGTNHE